MRQLRSQLEEERADRKLIEEECWEAIDAADELRSELSDLKQKSATAGEFPDVYDLLNRVKAEDSKSKLTPGDIKKIFRILKDS